MQLWEYIDGSGNEATRLRITQLIETDALWKETYNQLMEVHNSISAVIETGQPSLRFTRNVMDAVAGIDILPATRRYINPAIMKGMAAFFIIPVILLISYCLFSINWLSPSLGYFSGIKRESIHLERLFSSTFFNTAIAINVILGLVITDLLLRKKVKREAGSV